MADELPPESANAGALIVAEAIVAALVDELKITEAAARKMMDVDAIAARVIDKLGRAGIELVLR